MILPPVENPRTSDISLCLLTISRGVWVSFHSLNILNYILTMLLTRMVFRKLQKGALILQKKLSAHWRVTAHLQLWWCFNIVLNVDDFQVPKNKQVPKMFPKQYTLYLSKVHQIGPWLYARSFQQLYPRFCPFVWESKCSCLKEFCCSFKVPPYRIETNSVYVRAGWEGFVYRAPPSQQ